MAGDRTILQIIPAADGWRAAFAAYDHAHPVRLWPLACWALVEERMRFEDDPERTLRAVVGLVVDSDRNLDFCDSSPMFLGYALPGADTDDLDERALRFWEDKAKRGELPWPPRE